MRDDIWYREELTVLRDLVKDAVRRVENAEQMLALGHLHLKLEAAIAAAPSGRTPEAAA